MSWASYCLVRFGIRDTRSLALCFRLCRALLILLFIPNGAWKLRTYDCTVWLIREKGMLFTSQALPPESATAARICNAEREGELFGSLRYLEAGTVAIYGPRFSNTASAPSGPASIRGLPLLRLLLVELRARRKAIHNLWITAIVK